MNADPFRDYDLTQALILLGRRMYGNEWSANHNELRLPPWSGETPEQVKAKLEELERKFDAVKVQLREQDEKIRHTVVEAEIDAATAEKDRLFELRSYLYNKKNELPTYGDGFIQHYETCQRRKHAETRLIHALAAKEISFWCWGSTPGEDGPWVGKPGYKYSIELSIVRWRSKDSANRWQFVRIHREPFDEWLKTISPAAESALEELPLEESATIWFRSKVVAWSGPPPKKAIMLSELEERFPGLGRRAALRIWDNNVPSAWKKSGPKKA